MKVSHQTKRLVFVTVSLALLGAVWVALPPAVHVWSIPDAAKRQERRFSDWFHSFSSGLFAIRIIGNLSKPAHLETPLGQIELPEGDFDFITYASESWSTSATIKLSPSEGSEGNLTVFVCFGSCPPWVLRPPSTAQPVLYTGRWTAYHPGTDKKAWTGEFHQGVKWGEFTFWDQEGNVTRNEIWDNGTRKG